MAKISTRLNPIFRANGVVSYRGIPVYRAQAWLLELVKDHGVTPVIISGIRDDKIIHQHNRQFGTNLHGQEYLVRLHNSNPSRYPAANSPDTTSHCHHADGNLVYGTARHDIPLIMNGIDALDGKTAVRIRNAATDLGFRVAIPYRTGSEIHHFSPWPHNVNDYVRRLRRAYAKMLARKLRRRRKRK